MSFWLGAMKGFSDDRREEADRNYKEQIDKQAGEEKIALTLLESEDPEIQMAGLSILQAAMQPPKRKKGIRGSLGEYESTAGLEPLLQLANQFRGLTEGRGAPQTPATPGGAAMPLNSPVEPEAQNGPNPGLLGMAMGGADAGMAAMTPFGGIPMGPALNAPQTFAADASITPNGTINMGQIAGRVSRDRGIPSPGERARMFWPTAASKAAAQARSKMEAEVGVLQALGATPQQILAATLAKQGFSQGTATTSGEEWVVVPGQADPVLAFHFRDPSTGQAFMAYTGPDGQPTPLPPGTTRAPAQARAGAAAAGGASLTSYMTQEQMLSAGIVAPEDNWPPGLYKVQQKGENYFVMPYQPPSPAPAAAVGAGTNPATGARMTMDRAGGVSDIPGTAPRINPRVTAAKTLMAAVREQEKFSGIPTDIATLKLTTENLVKSGQYPALVGLTFEQIAQLEKLDEMTSDEALEPILKLVPTPPPGAAAAPAGAPATPGAKPQARVPQGDDWGDRVADRLIREQGSRMRRPQPGTVQGRHVVR